LAIIVRTKDPLRPDVRAAFNLWCKLVGDDPADALNDIVADFLEQVAHDEQLSSAMCEEAHRPQADAPP
jgi:hypothetical protein